MKVAASGLSRLVVCGLLEERSGDPLGGRTGELAFEHQRVDGAPHVVSARIPAQRDLARRPVDRDERDSRAEGEVGRPARLVAADPGRVQLGKAHARVAGDRAIADDLDGVDLDARAARRRAGVRCPAGRRRPGGSRRRRRSFRGLRRRPRPPRRRRCRGGGSRRARRESRTRRRAPARGPCAGPGRRSRCRRTR